MPANVLARRISGRMLELVTPGSLRSMSYEHCGVSTAHRPAGQRNSDAPQRSARPRCRTGLWLHRRPRQPHQGPAPAGVAASSDSIGSQSSAHRMPLRHMHAAAP